MKKLFMLFIVILFLFSSCSKNQLKTQTVFSDNSELITITDFCSFHRLFDNIGIYFYDRSNWIATIPDEDYFSTHSIEQYSSSNNLLVSTNLIIKYSYSDKKHIAYYDYDTQKQTGSYAIYSVYENCVRWFDSIDELYLFALSENIVFTQWYYTGFFNLCQEKQIAESNNWSIYSVDSIVVVRNGYEDMFAGKINTYICENDFLAFHIEINDSIKNSLRAFNNPILKIKENNIIDYTFLFRVPIYYDCYIVVNTSDNSYEIFNKKKDAEMSLKNKNVVIKWQEIRQ